MFSILGHQGNDIKTALRLPIALVQMTVTKKIWLQKTVRIWERGTFRHCWWHVNCSATVKVGAGFSKK